MHRYPEEEPTKYDANRGSLTPAVDRNIRFLFIWPGLAWISLITSSRFYSLSYWENNLKRLEGMSEIQARPGHKNLACMTGALGK